MAKPKRLSCSVCGKTFTPARSDALTCSNACRQRAYRLRKNPPETDAVIRARAVKLQLHEALRLGEEFALRRPGTQAKEITRARIKEAHKVASAWKGLAAELQRRG